MTAHTPGPWTVGTWIDVEVEDEYGNNHPDGLTRGQFQIFPIPEDAEAEANARLISASPDLLEMLTLIVDTGFEAEDEYGGKHWAISEKIRGMAREAIAKAEGGE